MVRFRGETINGEWHFGLLSKSKGHKGQPEKGFYISNSADMPWAYRVRSETVGMGIENHGKWFYEGDICENPFVGDLWVVRFEDDCFKVGLIPNSGIIKHPDNAKYPLHTELLCDMAHILKPFTTKWDNSELLGGQNEQGN